MEAKSRHTNFFFFFFFFYFFFLFIFFKILFKVGLFTYSSIITNLNQLFTKNTATNRNYTNLQFWLFTDPAITLIAKPVLNFSFESCNTWECFYIVTKAVPKEAASEG